MELPYSIAIKSQCTETTAVYVAKPYKGELPGNTLERDAKPLLDWSVFHNLKCESDSPGSYGRDVDTNCY
jgi:hypothetical protein